MIVNIAFVLCVQLMTATAAFQLGLRLKSLAHDEQWPEVDRLYCVQACGGGTTGAHIGETHAASCCARAFKVK